MIIYLYRNAVNGKVYIDQIKTILAQRNQHDSNDYKGCGSFWNAIEKYSWDKFFSYNFRKNAQKYCILSNNYF